MLTALAMLLTSTTTIPTVLAASHEPALGDVTAHVWRYEDRAVVALTWPGKQTGFGCTRYRKAPRVTHGNAKLVDVDLHPPRWVGEVIPSRRCFNRATFTFDAGAVGDGPQLVTVEH